MATYRVVFEWDEERRSALPTGEILDKICAAAGYPDAVERAGWGWYARFFETNDSAGTVEERFKKVIGDAYHFVHEDGVNNLKGRVTGVNVNLQE